MSLHFETGHPITADARELEGDPQRLRIVDHNGRCVFEIYLSGDSEIEVRGVEYTKARGKVYTNCLAVHPSYSNQVTITLRRN